LKVCGYFIELLRQLKNTVFKPPAAGTGVFQYIPALGKWTFAPYVMATLQFKAVP
jgi:hypothetical protein